MKTSQNALNEPIITTDGAGLPVEKFVSVYDKNTGEYQLKKAHESRENIATNGNVPRWARKNTAIIACLLDPEQSYQEFGGWDNMLTAVGGWTYRETHGDKRATVNTVASVNSKGSVPISEQELKIKIKSWFRGWTY